MAPELVSGLISPGGVAVSGEDLFLTSFAMPNNGAGIVSKYTTSGEVVDRTLIQLFVADIGNGDIGKYTTSGEPLNAKLIPEVPSVSGIAVFRNSLFVADSSLGTISQYNATTGELVNTLSPA